MAKILLVDDEEDLVWAIKYSLESDGYNVITACNGRDAIDISKQQKPDLIILDVIMPELDGYQVCIILKQDPELASIPILFLTKRCEVDDRIQGLELGSDDYLVKPFNSKELKARIKAILRRSENKNPKLKENNYNILSVGPIILNTNTFQVVVNNESKQLTLTEFKLLYHLMTHPQQIFSSEQLLEQVWGYPPRTADTSLVRNYVRNLRNKIEEDPSKPAFICRISNIGYILKVM